MPPTRKSRSVNKRLSSASEISPSKGGENAKKTMLRKRKLSDMLGSQWSKEELERFYEAYRKYGKDWKKVAAGVRERTAEMVESLYTMNRAYLSLPEGTASVVGLIAMMTDHYSNLAASDSEQESNDGVGTSRKSQKRARGKSQPSSLKSFDGDLHSHSQPVASSSGCLSLLKKKRSGSRPVVGKRTPRFPVSFSYEKVNGEKFYSPTRQGLKLKVDGNDEDVAHEVALALAEASQRGSSPQVSHAANRRTGSFVSSPVQSGEVQAELELRSAKNTEDMDEDGFEGSFGSMEADNGDFARERNFLMGNKGAIAAEIRREKRLNGKNLELDDSETDGLDDIKEACSGTEEGQTTVVTRGKLDPVIAGTRSSSQVPRKKTKKVLFSRDEASDFGALEALADLSLMMPNAENELMLQVKDEENDLVDKFAYGETVSSTHQRDKPKSLGAKTKGNRLGSGVGAAAKTSKFGKAVAGIPLPVPQQSTAKLPRRKPKASTAKILETEANADTRPSASQEAEVMDDGKKLTSKGKRSSHSTSNQQGKSVGRLELSSSSTDLREKDDSAQSTIQVHMENQVNLPTKVRSRRKMDLQKPQRLEDVKHCDIFLNENQPGLPGSLAHDGTLSLKEKLPSCLSNHRLRRWCAFEWFYSAVDYPWFAKREFVEYLNHVGLGHVPRLTRVEWGVIRSSLGKPRRFSQQFLKEEKEKLNQYRESVRRHYTELRAGTREGLPTDLARPLSVGQRVVAIHPRTREIHDGNVLTVDHTRCRVQFDRPELGVEFVLDIDCMPLNPLENMPTSLSRNLMPFENFNELKLVGHGKDKKLDGYIKFSTTEGLEHIEISSHASPPPYPMSNLLKQSKGFTNPNSPAKIGVKETAANSKPSNVAQMRAKEADIIALAELTRALDKKEAVVSELKHMNDDVLENQMNGDNALKDSESFKKQYAAVLVQLNEVNDQVTSALRCLRERNTYQGSSPVARPSPTTNVVESSAPFNLFDQHANHLQESGPNVHDIVDSSRTKARTMVDAAMQAMSSLKGGGNTVDRIEEAIDYISNRLSMDDSGMGIARQSLSTDPILRNPTSHDLFTSSAISSLHPPEPELKNVLGNNEAQVPSELVSQCVATLLMIQKCTERQFPPADVAQILDSAVTGLQPCCSQNLPVYAEIQKCMGIIRNQILALIPT